MCLICTWNVVSVFCFVVFFLGGNLKWFTEMYVGLQLDLQVMFRIGEIPLHLNTSYREVQVYISLSGFLKTSLVKQ